MTNTRSRLIDDALYVLALLVPVVIGASRYADVASEEAAPAAVQQRHATEVAGARAGHPERANPHSR
jgi:hypothetical protein